MVREFFREQLDQYLEWINNRGLSLDAQEDTRSEMLDHQDHLDSQRHTEMYLPIERFKRKMGVTDEDWFDSLPNALTELRKGRRDMLQRVLEAAESLEHYSYDDAPAAASAAPIPALTTSSPLGVPLHSELIRLGFLDFVDSRKDGSRLFPDYSYTANGGYGRNLGRWCNESFLPKLGIKQPGLVFHSLRHTVVTRLGQSGVAETIVQCIVGHARSGVTQEVYFREGYTLEQLKEAIDRFAVPSAA